MKKQNLTWNHYLSFRPLWGISVFWQITAVVLLFLLQSYMAWWMIVQDLNYGGLPVEWTGILAPIYEEIIFRGVILTLLVTNLGTARAILFSAFLFGLWHFRNILYLGPEAALWWQMIFTFGLGIVLAWITIKTQSVWPSVVLHYLNNIWAPISWLIFGTL